MVLVSGRPISFKMDLYNPLYVGRPTVEPELFASLRPPTYNGALTRSPELPALAATPAAPMPAPPGGGSSFAGAAPRMQQNAALPCKKPKKPTERDQTKWSAKWMVPLH